MNIDLAKYTDMGLCDIFAEPLMCEGAALINTMETYKNQYPDEELYYRVLLAENSNLIRGIFWNTLWMRIAFLR